MDKYSVNILNESSIYGIGPIKKGDISLSKVIDLTMLSEGMKIYNNKCTPCHKPYVKFIGPAPKGILSRRTPEWIMNMILNPEQMIKEDATAKALLIEFNGAPMANQNLTKIEARMILEYFRSL